MPKAESLRDNEFLEQPAPLVLPLEEYKTLNFRLDGLRKLQSVNAQMPAPIYVVPDQTFRFYRQSPEQCMDRLNVEIIDSAKEVAALSKKKTITLRRAYDIPGLANPEGPRFLGLKPDELATGVQELFDFAIKRKYDVPGAEIACFFYFFIDPENKPLEEIKRDDVLPYGGYMIPLTDDGTRFQILATWGNNETLIIYETEGRPIETYDIEADLKDPSKIRILRKTVVPKETMHYTARDGRNSVVSVPFSHQLEQVMYDSEIVDVARSATLLIRQYGPQKAEFSSDGERVLFNESTDATRELQLPQAEQSFSHEGTIFVVSSVEDVEKLSKFSDEKLSRTIVYATDRKRGSLTNNTLAQAFEDRPLVILYAGTSRTAHAMKVFSEMSHSAFPIGQQDFLDGDSANIQLKNGVASIENLTTERTQEIVPLPTAHKRGVSSVGGKAERISYLITRGFNVPPGVVLTSDFFDEVLHAFRADRTLASLIADPTININDINQVMQRAIPHIPDELWSKVVPLLKRFKMFLPDKKVIIRSSANVEDLRNQSFAGIFESIPNQTGEEAIRKAALECIYSIFTPSVAHYLGSGNISKLLDIKLALVVQEMVNARISGTAFGGDPQTRDTHVVLIEAKHGYGSEIVEGEGVEERLVLGKEKGDFKLREGQRLLTEPEETFLFHLVQRLEDEFGYPQDIEWSIDTNNRLWVLQARDL